MADKPMMKIAITPPVPIADEHEYIVAILEDGWDYVHLRHPSATTHDMRRLIEAIPQRFHNRLKLHGHFELLNEFNLGGIHLNSRCPEAPRLYSGNISRTCHAIDKAERFIDMEYVTLSPIFDSISKPGYTSAFSSDQLSAMKCRNAVALGGVTPLRIDAVNQYPFIGYAVLGYLFNSNSIDELRQKLKEFK